MHIDLQRILDDKTEYQECLFQRGFLITDDEIPDTLSYPFYGNWNLYNLKKYNFVIQKNVSFYFIERQGSVFFLIGHAYNPYDMEYDENKLLEKLSALKEKDFWDYESTLTGIYVIGKIDKEGILYHWSDCAGMRISYYGTVHGKYYVTSHTNIVAWLCNLQEDPYVTKLKKSRYFSFFGNVLPGDLSAYCELKRTVPNHYYSSKGTIKRFYPIEPIKECETEKEYQEVLLECSDVLKKTMLLCGEKWNGKKIAISVTGGKDSGETFASANGIYEKFDYFSYISKPEEAVDADAAAKMCAKLGLSHTLIKIPDEDTSVHEFDLINELIYFNGGNIGYIKPNEVRKRSVLIDDHTIEIEVKSWVNEIVRAYWYKKYAKKRFPQKPTGKYLTTLYKIFIENRYIYYRTSKIFQEYIEQYMNDSDIRLVGDWTTLWSWEFGFSAGEGQSLFAEHMLSYDITIPFNNRRLIDTMLKPKLQDRIEDRLQKDIIKINNPEQAALNIDIVNAAHTNKRAIMEKIYLNVNSHLPF